MVRSIRNKILVVEDDSQVLTALRKRLSHAGFVVLTADNGQNAIQQAKLGRPDAITLDLRLPDCCGLEVAEAVRSYTTTASTPIVFVTGKVDRMLQDECMELGSCFYVRKPYDPQLLITTLQHLTETNGHKAGSGFKPQEVLHGQSASNSGR